MKTKKKRTYYETKGNTREKQTAMYAAVDWKNNIY